MSPFVSKSVLARLDEILETEVNIMAAIDDLTQRVTDLEAEELQILKDIQTLVNAPGPAEATLQAIADRVGAVTAALKAGDPVPPVVVPPPAPSAPSDVPPANF